MRTINDHKVNPANDKIEIRVTDEPGAGGANHVYEVWLPDTVVDGPSGGHIHGPEAIIRFQNGPINENGINGLTQEVLLAILADRLRSFQSGPYACRENALALTKIEEAQHWLHSRTLARMQRGVEGTHKV
ncbi:hypothetical protein [Agrobacterium tumefaciens]|uniref:Acb2/Tad1 hairpin domain-containing protein n=1 Tax=Agrobacterium tumefaciens TaxID=358 RepID=A0A2L2L8H5_AGRTU|nr:hypothetical protein [Agrobacterium tumefaciens]AVH40619.1 hypothetical protein At1D1609_05670 [Agrobacterium tumefaciens]AVH43996.1 hypothetical protein At1D1609_39490 [Agrobacterium tumefaciens]